MALLVHILVTAVAVWVTTALPGVTLGGQDTGTRIVTLAVVAIVFGVVNAVLKPVAKTLGCLLYVLTLGLFGLVVNALLFWLTSWLAGRLALPFHVDGFWPAFWGAIIVTIVSSVLHAVVRRVRPAREGG
ncbi:putative membrane protein [Halopolyspora algeriensis]|uniref:Putative membrane protein n=1 Tax=Halopolyspora algeriensis TaxID=1500506 RepID=A0A368VTP0_9ACTN|nr:phage holin family protein [Halopolyspora algeriensis]RCW43937.1 putative membrane protein [Halopolyspora algeriensis]TQM53560.1 putative membrane protein [Halopolyspora algeriensis]